eukprot:TRINITY_DN4771_c0_g1::TRINITY_DN4771_c0_g1_i1::g.21417::m.21417 TRINITY_DN4771_c0_g1::TRINITY_DN4771_c0_g1_i1::g.21417  ORF type:complete len:231 (+),score=25.72,sp/Q9AYU0/QR2_TRIVS/53.03/1e-65,Flavodoxin_1/PF00258.20/9.2e-10,FMN_red/PF03358.10/9.6e-09,Flavodoxin_2/PF02525.12/0.0027,Flavodoxin_5/PF12724.2/0.21,Flavodoxin_5/PF12724.2/34 TRINITY_DN4771_c0_g1_i1:221-913(+)
MTNKACVWCKTGKPCKFTSATATETTSALITIVYYSMYGHILKVAEAIKEGVERTGARCQLRQVQETLPKEVLELMHAPCKAEHPVATPQDLVDADGVMFGIPTRFGTAPAQVRALIDSTGGLWQAGKLITKPAGLFFSAATQGAGQETTALSLVPTLTHHGMVFVPLGYQNPSLFDHGQGPHGGSPYGAGTLAGRDGSRKPTDLELSVARSQGEAFAKTTIALKKGLLA